MVARHHGHQRVCAGRREGEGGAQQQRLASQGQECLGARRSHALATTGNAGGAYNLDLSHGPDDLAALVKKMRRGLLVTELMGQGVNMVTGDYSRGAAGYWVDHGEIQHPVEEITIAGNMREMLRDIVAIGSDTDRRGGRSNGSILVERMTVAGH